MPRFARAAMLAPTTAWYAVLLAGPLVVIVVYSFGRRAFAGGYQTAFTLHAYRDLPTRSTAFTNTLFMAALGTILCLLIAYPFAYYLSNQPASRKTVLLMLVIIPFWTSSLIRTYAWVVILGSQGVPRVTNALGLTHDLVLLNTRFSVLFGIVYNYLPLMILPIYVSLEQLDRRLIEASKDLGSSDLRTLRQVTLPLSAPGIITGSMLVFILLTGEYLIPTLLGGQKIYFLGNALVDLFLYSRDWPLGAAVAVAIIALMLGIVGVYLRLTSRTTGRQEVSLL
jgi:spermidine/putrescine transport system permease protein